MRQKAELNFKPKKRGLWAEINKYKFYYMLILPALLYFFIWHYIPMFGIVVAFQNFSPFEGLSGILNGDWVGLRHFNRFFNSVYFWNVMRNTVLISGYKLIFGFPLPIVLALLLNEVKHAKFKKIVQTISYMPHFISMVVIAGLLHNIFSTDGGLFNEVRKWFGAESVFFLGTPEYFRSILVGQHMWSTVGWGSIVYLAAISGVDQELYEAATLDGAGRFKQTIHITLPSIANVVIIMLILRVGGILNAGFESVLLLYSPAVYDVADIVDTFVYREGLQRMNYSYSAAIGLFKSIIGIIAVLGTDLLAKRMGQEGLW